jgi:DNA-binding HxlR family transcriptional regulator
MATRKARVIPGAVAPARPPELQHTKANCRAHEMLTRVGDKWSVHVIHVLSAEGTLRFGELLRRVPAISQRMLTVTLRGLERDGLVHRTMYPEVPPRVEYAVTPLGATLREIVRSLVVWSSAHLVEVDAARARYDQKERGWGVADGKPESRPPGID